jgi:putative hydrolase of the HAD superfamily
MNSPSVTTLFLDIGGVLLTNGWDHSMRKRAAETFNLDYEEMNERHHLTFDTYEEGKLSLDEYLNRVVFYEKRTFLPADFRSFMFQQSQPYEAMIGLIREAKKRHKVKIVAVSNEGRELTAYRTEHFGLGSVIDSFVVSSFVHFRKPDADIYRIALDIAQVSPDQVLYIEDRQMFIEVAGTLGIRGIRHIDATTTRAALGSFGLSVESVGIGNKID